MNRKESFGAGTRCPPSARTSLRAAAENPSRLAPPEPGLRHRLADGSPRGADTIPAGTIAHARPVEPTTLGRRERRLIWDQVEPQPLAVLGSRLLPSRRGRRLAPAGSGGRPC